jgi:hypothetical protein
MLCESCRQGKMRVRQEPGIRYDLVRPAQKTKAGSE